MIAKKTTSFIFVLFLFSGVVFGRDEYDDDEILIQLAPGVSIETIEDAYDVSVREKNVVPGIVPPIIKMRVDDSDELETTVAAMEKDNRILKVEFNFFSETPEGVRRTLAVIDRTPTNSEYIDQDALNRVRARQAHRLSRGEGVIVAVIDTGVDYNHPRLANHILRDDNEIVGYDFIDDDEDPMDETDGLDEDNDSLIDEGAGHGTHVAGLVALLAPEAKIMPLRVLNSDGIGTVDRVVNALNFVKEYANDNSGPGSDRYKPIVINLSLGLPKQSFTLLKALQEVLSDGIPVIASAGNTNSSKKHYPAASQIGKLDVISVTATDRNDVKAGFSNYGRWINLSAPGVGIYSTFLNSRFATWDGTSMSSPFVSAEAALIMSALLARSPGRRLQLDQILSPLKTGIDSIYGVNSRYKSMNELGAGRINMESAVRIASGSDILRVNIVAYQRAGQKLIVKVKSSSAPHANLNIQGFGKMTYEPATGFYSFTRTGITSAPSKITIISSEGGITCPRVAIQ